MKSKCKDCHHYVREVFFTPEDKEINQYGRCHRYPPVPRAMTIGDDELLARWPRVYEESNCGEWQEEDKTSQGVLSKIAKKHDRTT